MWSGFRLFREGSYDYSEQKKIPRPIDQMAAQFGFEINNFCMLIKKYALYFDLFSQYRTGLDNLTNLEHLGAFWT
jgi:hypothetical protein